MKLERMKLESSSRTSRTSRTFQLHVSHDNACWCRIPNTSWCQKLHASTNYELLVLVTILCLLMTDRDRHRFVSNSIIFVADVCHQIGDTNQQTMLSISYWKKCWWLFQFEKVTCCNKSATNIYNFSPAHFASNIRHQHRCESKKRFRIKNAHSLQPNDFCLQRNNIGIV